MYYLSLSKELERFWCDYLSLSSHFFKSKSTNYQLEKNVCTVDNVLFDISTYLFLVRWLIINVLPSDLDNSCTKMYRI